MVTNLLIVIGVMIYIVSMLLVGWLAYWRGVKLGSQNIDFKQKRKVIKPVIPPPPKPLMDSFGYAEFAPDDANIYYAECPFCETPMAQGSHQCPKCKKWTWEDK